MSRIYGAFRFLIAQGAVETHTSKDTEALKECKASFFKDKNKELSKPLAQEQPEKIDSLVSDVSSRNAKS